MIEPRRPFQFTLRTLLLLFVVAASSLAVFGAWGILAFLLVVGMAICQREAESLTGLVSVVAALFLFGIPAALSVSDVRDAHESGRCAQCRNNLKQIALSLLSHEEAIGSFPPVYTVDKSGKPLTSWRTRILPYMESNPLFAAYDQTLPWDAPKNKGVSSRHYPIFECPSESKKTNRSTTATTSYFAVVGSNAAWDGCKPRRLADFGKEASHTIMLVEVADAGVSWDEPKDVSLDTLGIVDGKSHVWPLSSNHRPPERFFVTYDRVSGVNVAMADGHVCFLRTDNLSPDELRKILQIGGYTNELQQSQGDIYAGERTNWPNIAALAVWVISVGTLPAAAVRSRKTRLAQPPPAAGSDPNSSS